MVVDGVSDLALKRSEYGAVIEAQGFDGLLQRLQTQIDLYRQRGRPT